MKEDYGHHRDSTQAFDVGAKSRLDRALTLRTFDRANAVDRVNAVGVAQGHQPLEEEDVFSESGEVSHTCSTHWVCWRIITSSSSLASAREPLALWAVQELTEGGLKVVLFEVRTWRSSMTFLLCGAPRGSWGASKWHFQVGGLRRHVDPVGPRLAENLEVKL